VEINRKIPFLGSSLHHKYEYGIFSCFFLILKKLKKDSLVKSIIAKEFGSFSRSDSKEISQT